MMDMSMAADGRLNIRLVPVWGLCLRTANKPEILHYLYR